MNLLFLVINLVSIQAGPTCRSLSLEGGGSHGAYEAGVISALASLTNPGDIAWNAVSGISVGAINVGALIQFPTGQETQAASYLVNLWKSLNSSSDIYKEWEGGLAAGLLFHSGVYSTEPLQKLLRTDLTKPPARNFTVGATNLDTGLFSTFDETVGNGVIDAIMCSAAPPFAFPPHQFEGYTWADGACVMNLDVASGIERCLQITEEENIITDLIFDSPYAGLANETSFKTRDVLTRMYHILSYDSSIWFTYNAQRAFPKVFFRYIIHPSGPLPGGNIPLNFTPAVIDYEIQLGINDTTNYLKSSKPGRVIIEELYSSLKSQTIYPNP